MSYNIYNRKNTVQQCYHVNVLTLSSPRLGEEISRESILLREQGLHHAGQKSNDISAYQTNQRPLDPFSSAKVLNIHEAYARIIRCFQLLK